MLIGTLRTALDMKEENLPNNEFLKRQKRIKGQNRLRNFYNYFCNEKNFSNGAILHKKEVYNKLQILFKSNWIYYNSKY